MSVALQEFLNQLSFVAEELSLATFVLSVGRQFEEPRMGSANLSSAELGLSLPRLRAMMPPRRTSRQLSPLSGQHSAAAAKTAKQKSGEVVNRPTLTHLSFK